MALDKNQYTLEEEKYRQMTTTPYFQIWFTVCLLILLNKNFNSIWEGEATFYPIQFTRLPSENESGLYVKTLLFVQVLDICQPLFFEVKVAGRCLKTKNYLMDRAVKQYSSKPLVLRPNNSA